MAARKILGDFHTRISNQRCLSRWRQLKIGKKHFEFFFFNYSRSAIFEIHQICRYSPPKAYKIKSLLLNVNVSLTAAPLPALLLTSASSKTLSTSMRLLVASVIDSRCSAFDISVTSPQTLCTYSGVTVCDKDVRSTDPLPRT